MHIVAANALVAMVGLLMLNAATVKSEAISADTIILTSTYFSYKLPGRVEQDSLYHYKTEMRAPITNSQKLRF